MKSIAWTIDAQPGQGQLLCRSKDVAYARGMTDRLEDSALMLRYRDGDIAAFDVLYRRHKDALCRRHNG